MAKQKTCSCGACVRVKRNRPERGDMWLCLGSGCEAVACIHCGDHLLPGGDKIPASELREAWEALQAMREYGKCHLIARSEGLDVRYEAHGGRNNVTGWGETPEAAVAALLQKQGGDHATD